MGRDEDLRIVQKIGVWFNTQYGGSVEKKQSKVSFKKLFDKAELDPPAPVKPRILHFYSRRFYHERVKGRVTARWQTASQLSSPPKVIALRNMVTKECWQGETDAFKAEVEAALENEHKAAVEAYSVATSGETPTTAVEYDM